MKTSLAPVALDASAVGLSGLCLIHCLALPLMAAALPLAGVVAEAEWVHRVFVAAAVFISGFAIFRSLTAKGGLLFPLTAATGLALLCAAAFAEPLHAFETPLTVLGALILAFAHIWRWTRHTPPGPAQEL